MMKSEKKGANPNFTCNRTAVDTARRVLDIEAEAIRRLKELVTEGFPEAVDRMLNCKGKILLCGVGKSGYVARKIASTLAGTGTPAFFIHPVEGLHGDLGMAEKGDIFVFISNSGETEEILRLLPFVRRKNCTIISMTGRGDSTMARNSDVVIRVDVAEEACPLGLAPTASTTAALAMGDALAVTLLEMRGFTRKDFAQLHPGGALGRKAAVDRRGSDPYGRGCPVGR